VHSLLTSSLPAPQPGMEYQWFLFLRLTPEESDGMQPPMKTGLILTFRKGYSHGFNLFSTHPGMPELSTL